MNQQELLFRKIRIIQKVILSGRLMIFFNSKLHYNMSVLGAAKLLIIVIENRFEPRKRLFRPLPSTRPLKL